MLAVDERCMLENFEEDVECYGKAGSVDYWCYDDKTGHYPFDRFDAYMRKYTGAVRAEGGARTGAGDAESVRIDMLRKYAQTRAPRTESELEHFSRLEEMPRGRYVECWSGALCRGAGAGLGSETAGQGPIRVIKGDGGQMWMAQAHWQYSAASVIAGALHDSSILLDSKRSGMNARVARSIRAGEYKRLNILELGMSRDADALDSSPRLLRCNTYAPSTHLTPPSLPLPHPFLLPQTMSAIPGSKSSRPFAPPGDDR